MPLSHQPAKAPASHRLGLLGVVALAMALSPSAWAQTDAPSDGIGAWLKERGMVATEAARQLRDRAGDLVIAAMHFLDVRYTWGGNDAQEGFDCSGFTRHVFQRIAGISLPRTADAQAAAPGFFTVTREALEPGDLVFFNTLRSTFSHVGIYVGDGKFIHAPKPGAQVRLESMRTRYWDQRFSGARRPE